MKRRMLLLASLFSVLGGTRIGRVLAAAASVGSVGLHSVGPAGISARIIPGSGEVGVFNVYMGAIYQGTLYLRWTGTQDWRPNNNLGFPVTEQVDLSRGYADVVVADFDISHLAGLDAYVGYGVREADVWLPGHLGKIHTVPGVVNGAMRYSDKVYALWTASYPFVVTRTGVAKVINKTSFVNSSSEYSYFNCWLADKPLNDGRILVSGQETRTTHDRKVLYINPLEDALYDYTGDEPADIMWRAVQEFDSATPTWGAKARVSGGWYYTKGAAWVLLFHEDGSSTPTTVKAGTFDIDGTIKLLVAYSN